jgi:hypothetical protein
MVEMGKKGQDGRKGDRFASIVFAASTLLALVKNCLPLWSTCIAR